MFTPQEAQDLAKSSAQRALTMVHELGLIRAGHPNAVGRTITPEDITQLSQEIAAGVVQALIPQTLPS